MPFTIKSRKTIETPLDAEYRKQVLQYNRDKDPSASKFAPKPVLRTFALVDDTVTISSELPEGAAEHAGDIAPPAPAEDSKQEKKPSQPVTPAEKNELGIFSIRV